MNNHVNDSHYQYPYLQLCETRWVERIKAVVNFRNSYVSIVDALEELTERCSTANTHLKVHPYIDSMMFNVNISNDAFLWTAESWI